MTQRPNITGTISPSDQNAVAEAVRAALSTKTPIYSVGGGICLDGAWQPSRPGVAVSLANLNRVLDHAADDMTITVEAGLTIDALNRHLTARRQWLPVDVPHAERATVGGAIAVNAAGPRQYAYGTMRDYVLGFTAIDGRGEVFSGGGRVVKNVAGYNLSRLMTGSRGSLGIMTQATLMVRPLSETASLLACEVPSFDDAEHLLEQLVRLPVEPVAVELSAGYSPQGNPLFGPILEGHAARLVVGFEGAAADVEWMSAQLREGWAAAGMTSPVLMPNLTTDKLWRWLASLPADVRIQTLSSRLVGLIADLLRVAPDSAIQARAGNGLITLKLADDVLANEAGRLDALAKIREVVAAAEGRMCLADASGCDRGNTTDEAIVSPEARIWQALKDRFDPANILNPGAE